GRNVSGRARGSTNRHRGRSAGRHEPLRHRSAGSGYGAGGFGKRRVAARSRLLHGKNRGRAVVQERGGTGRSGVREPEKYRAATASRRRGPGGGGARPSAAREADRRYPEGGRAHQA